jgi:uncharacterized membrane protein (DUF485 family)
MSTQNGVLQDTRRVAPRHRVRASLDELASRRFKVAIVLTVAMLVVYFAFILLIAFDKELLGRTITDGLSVGILLGVVVVFATWVLTWVYVAWANRRYEPTVRELRRQP